MTVSNPLHWPQGRTRTKRTNRQPSRFKLDMQSALGDLLEELERLGARYITVSCDAEGHTLKNGDWRPYKRAPEPPDVGVAVYFDLNGDQMCMSCDRWDLVGDNVRAIGLTIHAMRGIERWGSSEAVARAFTGFRHALPASGEDWKSVLDLKKNASMADVKRQHRALALKAHPDHGGSEHEMIRINQAMEAAKKDLGPQ